MVCSILHGLTTGSLIIFVNFFKLRFLQINIWNSYHDQRWGFYTIENLWNLWIVHVRQANCNVPCCLLSLHDHSVHTTHGGHHPFGNLSRAREGSPRCLGAQPDQKVKNTEPDFVYMFTVFTVGSFFVKIEYIYIYNFTSPQPAWSGICNGAALDTL